MTIRFFYNPNNGQFLNCDNSEHAIYYHNKKLSLPFDYYIRGIIKEDKLFLRVYYPFKDIDNLNYNELMNKSFLLLSEYKENILKVLKNEGFIINECILNCTNEDLKDYLKTCFV